MKYPRLALWALLPVLLLADGCVTRPKTDAKNGADDEYVNLPPKTGSNVPRRVKKSDLLAGKVPNQDTSAVEDANKDDFARSVRSGMKHDSGN